MKTLYSQNNPEQKELCWRYYNTWLKIISQSHSLKKEKDCIVLAQKQTNGIEKKTHK
jgi:hypothetical protein